MGCIGVGIVKLVYMDVVIEDLKCLRVFIVVYNLFVVVRVVMELVDRICLLLDFFEMGMLVELVLVFGFICDIVFGCYVVCYLVYVSVVIILWVWYSLEGE